MRYIGVDYGDKRIGIAVSDEEGKIAFPKTVVENSKGAAKKIKSLVEKEGAILLVLGLPRTFAGKESDQTRKVKKFSLILHKILTVPVEFENEILTTRLARNAGTREKSDAAEAALILQTYLDKKNKNLAESKTRNKGQNGKS